MPRPGLIVTPFVSNLITGTTFPNLPTADELESVKGILLAKQTIVNEELERARRVHFKKRRIDDEDGSGGRSGSVPRSADLDRARVDGFAKKASPAKVKRERNSASPAPSNASSVAFRPPQPPANVVTYGQAQKLKLKKKHKLQDSDDERARDRSTTLAMSPPLAHPQASSLKLKLPTQPKPRPDPSPAPTASGIDFSLPSQSSRPLIPPRPGVQKPLKPGPKRQADVDEDYSNAKAPNQVLFTTFWTSVEPYLRELREDDLAMLGFKADAPESYDIPPRGRHYTEVWDEEDGMPLGSTPRVSVPNMRPIPGNIAASGSHFVPVTELKDENLVEEFKGLGTITERVVAAFVADKEVSKAKSQAVAGKAAEDGGVGKEPLRVDVAELEDRMKRELRSVMLLGEHEEFDPTKREDDEITSALRSCQRQLLQQTTLNDARKSRLAEVAKQRLAFTEYTSMLEGIEKGIEQGWAKRVKKYGLTPNKKSSTSDKIVKPPVSDSLKQLVLTRKKWQESVGKIMRERKGQVFGLPVKSIYDGIEGEIEERDEKMVDDAVELEEGEDE